MGHGVDGVDEQIQHDQFHLPPVCFHMGQRLGKVQLGGNAFIGALNHMQRLFDEPMQVYGGDHIFTLAGVAQQLPGQRCTALNLIFDAVQFLN